MRQINKKTKWILLLVCVTSVLLYVLSGTVSEPTADIFIRTELSRQVGENFGKEWKTVRASGGRAGIPLMRPEFHYFSVMETTIPEFSRMSNAISAQHARINFFFGNFDKVENGHFNPHLASAKIAPWWQPETNSNPMTFVNSGEAGKSAFVYVFCSATNVVAYVQVIRR
jgi:hypothetical protein